MSFDKKRNILFGIPTKHDKGRHEIKLDIINDETNKTMSVVDLLYIDVVEYDEDLNSYNVIKRVSGTHGVQNGSQSALDCPGDHPVIIATLVFDLNVRKLSGAKRVDLVEKVADWFGMDVDAVRFVPGKGEKTAFNFKDVIFFTGGPGSIQDAQERGVSVSWKIGCGESVAGKRTCIVSV